MHMVSVWAVLCLWWTWGSRGWKQKLGWSPIWGSEACLFLSVSFDCMFVSFDDLAATFSLLNELAGLYNYSSLGLEKTVKNIYSHNLPILVIQHIIFFERWTVFVLCRCNNTTSNWARWRRTASWMTFLTHWTSIKLSYLWRALAELGSWTSCLLNAISPQYAFTLACLRKRGLYIISSEPSRLALRAFLQETNS